jgi:mono/diheme cytochrome c family protein
MRIEIKASVLAVLTSAGVLALTFGLAPFLRTSEAAGVNQKNQVNTNPAQLPVTPAGNAQQGHSLFARNCAHCHGDDARGDEGPTLYNLAMSDARIAKRIKEGIKGEMPKFGTKLNDMDIAALISYLRTLKD